MKYSRSQLRQMAREALRAREHDFTNWMQLLLALMLHTGLSFEAIEYNIEVLARPE